MISDIIICMNINNIISIITSISISNIISTIGMIGIIHICSDRILFDCVIMVPQANATIWMRTAVRAQATKAKIVLPDTEMALSKS